VFLNSGVATGGLVAVILSLLFHLTERRGYTTSVPAGLDNLPVLADHISQVGNKLDITQEQIMRLQLACEEIFVHITGSGGGEGEDALALRINLHEEELRVEMIYGRRLANLEDIKMPDNLMAADEQDLERLGLALFKNIVHDLHQAVISGTTYIWFKME
jgi:NCS2 family nucleobase:cation symporter-2/xanthine permease XanP